MVNGGKIASPMSIPEKFDRRSPRYWNRLDCHNQDGSFTDVTQEAGLSNAGDGNYMGVAVGDYDDDGCSDIIVTNYGKNVLDRFKRRIREITRRAKGVSIQKTIEELLYARLAQLFRLLRNPRGAGLSHPLGPVAASGRSVAAVEYTTPSPGRSVGAGGSAAPGQQHGRQRSWPLVPSEEQGPFCGAF